MKVSVIVPVWNTEKYLKKCLDSLVNQTLKDIEIIVVNDGSPDSSEVIIQKFVKKYPKIFKYIKKDNGGLGSARNMGLTIAQGEFIAFVDSDDWVEALCYEQMYSKAIETKSDIIVCDMVDHFENGLTLYHDCTHFKSVFEKTPSACNKMFRRTIIGNLKFFEDRLWYEDLNFTTKILLKTKKVDVVSKGFYHCNAHEGSIMNNNNSIKNLDIVTCIEDLKKYAQEKNIYDNELFTYLVFDHILITTIMRVAEQKSKNKKLVIKKLVKYCKENIKDYKNHEFYKNVSRNRKIVAYLNFYSLYFVSSFIIKLNKLLKKNR